MHGDRRLKGLHASRNWSVAQHLGHTFDEGVHLTAVLVHVQTMTLVLPVLGCFASFRSVVLVIMIIFKFVSTDNIGILLLLIIGNIMETTSYTVAL